MVMISDNLSLWTDSEVQMITTEGNVHRYLCSEVVDDFPMYGCADLSFPNGYNKGNRVFCEVAPCLTVATIRSLAVKVEE